MSDLNSVILEGRMKSVNLKTSRSGDVCEMVIESYRFTRDEKGVGHDHISRFTILTCGIMAKVTAKNFVENRGVRVFGRLECENWESKCSRMIVVAEYVEFKKNRR